MIVTLRPDGTATEKIGEFEGAGKWKQDRKAAWIHWDSGWTGLLRPVGASGFEFLTWKKDVSPDEAPNDRQAARYLGMSNPAE